MTACSPVPATIPFPTPSQILESSCRKSPLTSLSHTPSIPQASNQSASSSSSSSLSLMAVTRASLLIFAVALMGVGQRSSAEVHHVVGGDRGWDPSSNISAWSSQKLFTVGDKIWFTYSAASEGVLELGSRDEYDACDTRNPIKMYTDGLIRLSLDTEGSRYFVSNRLESCKNGLKLHVDVQPELVNGDSQTATTMQVSAMPLTVQTLADAPTTPSGSSALQFPYVLGSGVVFMCFMMFGRF